MDPLAIYATLLTLPTLAQIVADILAIAQGAGLAATAWIFGSPARQWIEIVGRVIDAWGLVPSQAVKGFFLDLATDPGDPGDVSVDQTPRPQWLSALGLGWYGVQRGGQTFATPFVTVKNNGAGPITFKPGQITAEQSAPGPDGGMVTYRNTPDPSKYTNVDGSITISAGASVVLPFQADRIGSYGSAVLNAVSVIVTQSYGPLVSTASTAATGQEREAPDTYRARCRAAAASLAPGGPLKAYLVAINTAKDGTPLQRFDGSGPVTITTAQVLPSSTTGVVTGYVAGPSGAVDDIDVSSANANITGIPLGVITDPRGVLPDTVTLAPTATDPNTLAPGFASCANFKIPVHYTAKIAASKVPGGAGVGTYSTPWKPSTGYAVGQVVSNGTSPARQYRVTTEGVSASSGGPTGTGGSILDGGISGVTWTYVADLATNSGSAAAGAYSGTLGLFASVEATVGAWLPTLGPGGLDQDGSGNGSVNTDDILCTVRDAPGTAAPLVPYGLRSVALTVPATSSTAISVGFCPVAGTITGTITVVAG